MYAGTIFFMGSGSGLGLLVLSKTMSASFSVPAQYCTLCLVHFCDIFVPKRNYWNCLQLLCVCHLIRSIDTSFINMTYCFFLKGVGAEYNSLNVE